jgi:hypothetical protein
MRTTITVSAEDSEEQKAIVEISRKIRSEFPEVKIDVTTESKKLLPEEVILLIVIEVSSEVILRLLDRLWNHLKQKNIRASLSSIENVQETAENFLRHKGLRDFRITKKDDRGLYTILIYQTSGHMHSFSISNSDLSILRYQEKDRY